MPEIFRQECKPVPTAYTWACRGAPPAPEEQKQGKMAANRCAQGVEACLVDFSEILGYEEWGHEGEEEDEEEEEEAEGRGMEDEEQEKWSSGGGDGERGGWVAGAGGGHASRSNGAAFRLEQQRAIECSQVSSEVLAALPQDLRDEIQGAQRAARSSEPLRSRSTPRPTGMKTEKKKTVGIQRFLGKMGAGGGAAGFKRATDAKVEGGSAGKLSKCAGPKTGTLQRFFERVDKDTKH